MSKHDETESGEPFPVSRKMVPKSKRSRKRAAEEGDNKQSLQLGMNVAAPMALRKARANSKVPLNLLEKLMVNPDHGLIQVSEYNLFYFLKINLYSSLRIFTFQKLELKNF